MNNINYKTKYLKYKIKYLELKGGTILQSCVINGIQYHNCFKDSYNNWYKNCYYESSGKIKGTPILSHPSLLLPLQQPLLPIHFIPQLPLPQPPLPLLTLLFGPIGLGLKILSI